MDPLLKNPPLEKVEPNPLFKNPPLKKVEPNPLLKKFSKKASNE